jgi:hypothetical protein
MISMLIKLKTMRTRRRQTVLTPSPDYQWRELFLSIHALCFLIKQENGYIQFWNAKTLNATFLHFMFYCSCCFTLNNLHYFRCGDKIAKWFFKFNLHKVNKKKMFRLWKLNEIKKSVECGNCLMVYSQINKSGLLDMRYGSTTAVRTWSRLD